MSGFNRLANAVAQLSLLTGAPSSRALDAAPLVKGGESAVIGPPGTFRNMAGLADDWDKRFERTARVVERHVEMARSGAAVRARLDKEEIKERILENHAGLGPVEVAFIEDTSESFVRKTRAQGGQQTANGYPKTGERERDD